VNGTRQGVGVVGAGEDVGSAAEAKSSSQSDPCAHGLPQGYQQLCASPPAFATPHSSSNSLNSAASSPARIVADQKAERGVFRELEPTTASAPSSPVPEALSKAASLVSRAQSGGERSAAKVLPSSLKSTTKPPVAGAQHPRKQSGASGAEEQRGRGEKQAAAGQSAQGGVLEGLGTAVQGVHGLNMLLVRLGFELLRAQAFDSWLKRMIQVWGCVCLRVHACLSVNPCDIKISDKQTSCS
jgi:hypothetical protein